MSGIGVLPFTSSKALCNLSHRVTVHPFSTPYFLTDFSGTPAAARLPVMCLRSNFRFR
jgi:hypothetical protein